MEYEEQGSINFKIVDLIDISMLASEQVHTVFPNRNPLHLATHKAQS